MSCEYNPQTNKYDIKYKEGKTYSYNHNNIIWLKNPEKLNPEHYCIYHNGDMLSNIYAIYVFHGENTSYWHICFEGGEGFDCEEKELQFARTDSKNVFEYLKQTAELSELRSKDDEAKLLPMQYKKIEFIKKDCVLAAYLNPESYKLLPFPSSTPIFPFGFNASQYKAVKAALENRISVIKGPPGTGKTQTILNIIANLLVAGKTILVVSSNNTAVANVLEKLSSPKYNMGFFIAKLGNFNNKTEFINNQTGKYPCLQSWKDDSIDNAAFYQDICERSRELNDIFSKQEMLANTKQELQELEVELQHFNKYIEDNNVSDINIRKNLKAKKIIEILLDYENILELKRKIPFLYKLKNLLLYGISDWSFYRQDAIKINAAIKKKFYTVKRSELCNEIKALEQALNDIQSDEKINQFSELSLKYLKNILYQRYGGKDTRQKFTQKDLFKRHQEVQKEYPVILSTTFSSRSSPSKNAVFDYLIMDEASQVDVATGALALSCAKNAVIVGDQQQLPNVIKNDVRKKADEIFSKFQINENYNFATKSFLKSVCDLFPNIPQTLLREHYRCHPKIINFCNQKFYDGTLVIMSKDNGEDDVLSAVKTVVGNHARDHMNQRQIDVVKSEILPYLSCKPEDVGIIAPYNDQVDTMRKDISDEQIEIATVHKFQGREKDVIIMTTVDDEISDFVDDPNLLNVAVSRAKKQLYIVVSGNKQPEDSNIMDLIDYIKYNNFEVSESKIYSIFDYLYKQYTEVRHSYLERHKINPKLNLKFDSEKLMYKQIKKTLTKLNLSTFSVICHQQLNELTKDKKPLNDNERKYLMNSNTHLDFLIINSISKKPILAVEVDGYDFHKEGTRQYERDEMKNHILKLYDIPYIRFATNGSREKEQLIEKLNEILGK